MLLSALWWAILDYLARPDLDNKKDTSWCLILWWAILDSNQGPYAYQAYALAT